MPIVVVPVDKSHNAFKVIKAKNMYPFKIGSISSMRRAYNKALTQLRAMHVVKKKSKI